MRYLLLSFLLLPTFLFTQTTSGGALGSRKITQRPSIPEAPKSDCKVVVSICVDGTGTVASAEYSQRGSICNDVELQEKAVNAAKRYRFAPSANGLECGTLTFNFISKPDSLVPSDMVFIKGGTFQMGDQFGEGDNDEKPVHAVTLYDFYLGKTEITFDQYDAYCTATGTDKPKDLSWGRGRRPVIMVDWYDAVEYCNWRSRQENLTPVYTIDKTNKDPTNKNIFDSKKWIFTVDPRSKGYRLPTEAEWEYAARESGRKLRFGNGKDIADPAEINFNGGGNYVKPYSIEGIHRDKTVEVGTLSKNSLGLYDMSGNVKEWCGDWYGEGTYADSPMENPTGPTFGTFRVCRGGDWNFYPEVTRASDRARYLADDRDFAIGFRFARNR